MSERPLSSAEGRAEATLHSLQADGSVDRAEIADTIRAFRAEVAALREELDDAVRSKEFTIQWYAERMERLTQMAKEHGIWSEMAAIIANGTASQFEPPTYAQLLNKAKYRAEAAEAALATARDALRVRPLPEWHEDIGTVLWWKFPIDEAPYCGSPLDDEWPGYHTHWTRVLVPEEAALVRPAAQGGG